MVLLVTLHVSPVVLCGSFCVISGTRFSDLRIRFADFQQFYCFPSFASVVFGVHRLSGDCRRLTDAQAGSSPVLGQQRFPM